MTTIRKHSRRFLSAAVIFIVAAPVLFAQTVDDEIRAAFENAGKVKPSSTTPKPPTTPVNKPNADAQGTSPLKNVPRLPDQPTQARPRFDAQAAREEGEKSRTSRPTFPSTPGSPDGSTESPIRRPESRFPTPPPTPTIPPSRRHNTDAQTAPQLPTEPVEKHKTDFEKLGQAGPATIPLGTEGELSLPAGYIFIPATQAAPLMNAMGNFTDENFIGLVVPDDEDSQAFIIIDYIPTGHIKDNDSSQISNADAILTSLKRNTEEGNKKRREQGHDTLEVQGWAEKPRYDKVNHRLIWAVNARNIGESDSFVVNYNTRVLGRTGLFVLNLVTEPETLQADKRYAEDILAATKFLPGRTYADYNPSTDDTAEYGLTGLILGGGALIAAKKFGLLAFLVLFLKKGWFIIIIVGGALWKFLFGRK
ncbi:MAG: DUF2167 domain-containing protein [Planctomycetaceae bacterium]|jgi:uncharacterized membrane-anchored protein|nr:DUF2167 domain-containing protein [Planctomycetaceae bacterium]